MSGTAGIRRRLAAALAMASLGSLLTLAPPTDTASAEHLVGDVTIGMPFAGRFGATQYTSYPGQHHVPAGGDWATDLYAPAGTPVKVIAPGAGELRVESVVERCAGTGVRVNVFQNGTKIGWLYYTHLANPQVSPGQQIGSGHTIGFTSQWPWRDGCWEVDTPEGVHTHFEAFNVHNYPCWVPHASHTPLPEGNTIGALGGTARSSGPCPAPPTNRIVSIRSSASGKYVAAELGYTGTEASMLRAARDVALGWEQFRLIGDCASACAIQSVATGRYVSAELDYGGDSRFELRGRATEARGWEQFRLVGDCNWGCAIYSIASGRYVSAELGYQGAWNGMLRARADVVQAWETFTIQGR